MVFEWWKGVTLMCRVFLTALCEAAGAAAPRVGVRESGGWCEGVVVLAKSASVPQLLLQHCRNRSTSVAGCGKRCRISG